MYVLCTLMTMLVENQQSVYPPDSGDEFSEDFIDGEVPTDVGVADETPGGPLDGHRILPLVRK